MSLYNMSVLGPFRSKSGLFLGVIKGLAEHWAMSPFTLRIIVVTVSIVLAFWPVVIIYFIAAIIMPKEPAIRPLSDRDRELYLLGQADPKTLVDSLIARADHIEKRARRLEDIITSKGFRARRPL
jgi:phage shock protein C